MNEKDYAVSPTCMDMPLRRVYLSITHIQWEYTSMKRLSAPSAPIHHVTASQIRESSGAKGKVGQIPDI